MAERMPRVPGPFAAGALTLVACAALALYAPAPLLADAQQDRRMEPALKLFRALLSADLELEKKVVDERRLLIVFFHTDDRRRADELAKLFGKSGATETIRGLPVIAEASVDPRFAAYEHRVPAGIFVAQPPSGAALRDIIQFGVANHVIVYSPFEGHVEKGVLGGLSVEAQVRPYLNQATLTASHISLKKIFLDVSKVYR
ncbi:MAG: hypothetical protein ABIT01_00395 [Thermoanaerobaculia bacterium]